VFSAPLKRKIWVDAGRLARGECAKYKMTNFEIWYLVPAFSIANRRIGFFKPGIVGVDKSAEPFLVLNTQNLIGGTCA